MSHNITELQQALNRYRDTYAASDMLALFKLMLPRIERVHGATCQVYLLKAPCHAWSESRKPWLEQPIPPALMGDLVTTIVVKPHATNLTREGEPTVDVIGNYLPETHTFYWWCGGTEADAAVVAASMAAKAVTG